MRSTRCLLNLIAIGVLLGSGTRCTAQVPTSKDGWISTLAQMTYQPTDYQYLEILLRSDPELVYGTLHDGWGQIKNAAVRQLVIQLLVNGTGMRILNGRM